MTSVSQKEILQKNALSHEFPKKVKLAYLQKRWIQGIESQRQTSRKLDANVQNTQPPTRFHPDWNMTKAILFGSPFLGGVNTVKACFLFICNNRCKFAVRTLHFGTPNPPQLCCFSKITHQTIATGDPNVTGRVRWMFRKKRPAHKGCEQRMLRFHEQRLGCPLIWCALQKKSGAKMGFQIHLILESHPLSMENLQNAYPISHLLNYYSPSYVFT